MARLISDDSLCATLEKLTIAHTLRVWKFASRSLSIRIIYSFVTLLLELLSANHTEAPSRINAAFCHVTLPYTRTARASVHENCLRFWRDLPVSLLLAIYFLSNGCKKLFDVASNANYLCMHLTERINYRIIEHRLPPAWNKS